jgi:hypothetical protein
MTNTTFPLFHAAFPPGGERVPYNPSRHDALAAKVPASIASEWRSFGFGAYGEGLLWTPMPDESFLNPDDWPALDGTGIEVLRTAFADVCLWQGGRFLKLNPHSGKSFSYNTSAEVLFDSVMIEKHFRKSVLLEDLFHKARKRLGDLSSDECFGFAPLPALGGAIAEEYIIKAKMREYIAMAAQVLG